MGMALNAQAQSRATISELVDLKYPRQATFVKQSNIANGPQQVNNATHARNIQPRQNELLEDASDECTKQDTRKTQRQGEASNHLKLGTSQPGQKAPKARPERLITPGRAANWSKCAGRSRS